jgi:hypothetical protein
VKRREFITLLGGEVAEAEAQGLPYALACSQGIGGRIELNEVRACSNRAFESPGRCW